MNLFLVWLCFLYEFGTCTGLIYAWFDSCTGLIYVWFDSCTGLIYAWFDSCRGLIHQTHTYKIDEIIFSYL